MESLQFPPQFLWAGGNFPSCSSTAAESLLFVLAVGQEVLCVEQGLCAGKGPWVSPGTLGLGVLGL